MYDLSGLLAAGASVAATFPPIPADLAERVAALVDVERAA